MYFLSFITRKYTLNTKKEPRNVRNKVHFCLAASCRKVKKFRFSVLLRREQQFQFQSPAKRQKPPPMPKANGGSISTFHNARPDLTNSKSTNVPSKMFSSVKSGSLPVSPIWLLQWLVRKEPNRS